MGSRMNNIEVLPHDCNERDLRDVYVGDPKEPE